MLNRLHALVDGLLPTRSTKTHRKDLSRRALRYEPLENRELLTINWVNAASNNFDAIYNTVADPSRGAT